MSKLRLQNIIDFVILAIFAVFSINTIVNHFQSDGVLSIQHYIGFLAIICSFTIRLLNRKIGRYFIGFQLILGSLNLFNYTISSITFVFTIRFTSIWINSIGIQPLSFLVMILFIILNFKSINRILRGIFEDSPEDKAALYKIKKDKYENEFRGYTITELEDIIKNRKNSYEPFARNIMHKILNEKKSNVL